MTAAEFFKVNFKWLLAAGLLLVVYLQQCTGGVNTKPTSDTTSHTVYVPQPIIINPPYVPQQSGSTVYVPIPSSNQPVTPATDIIGLTNQVMQLNTRIENLAKEYYAIKHYDDSIQLKDSSGTRVGVVNLKQTVSENTLKETIPSYQLSFPHTTTVITNTIPYKPRNQVYIGAGFQAGNATGFTQAQLGLQFKNKADNVFGIAGIYDLKTKHPGVGITYYKLIKLRK